MTDNTFLTVDYLIKAAEAAESKSKTAATAGNYSEATYYCKLAREAYQLIGTLTKKTAPVLY